jgi:hypothetical protein
MTLWLTLLLVWTTGIPAALFLSATLVAVFNQRRTARLPSLAVTRGAATACGRRAHRYGRLARGSGSDLGARVGGRRPI